jgi:hypothetical protein
MTILSKCMEIRQSGIYELDRDLRGTGGAACLEIHDVSDVQLDCGGHSVMSEGSALAAVWVQAVKNFRIMHCSLPQPAGYSLYVGDSSEGTISLNEFQDVLIHEPHAEQASSIHVIDNRFFAPLNADPPVDEDRTTGVVPITAGMNWLLARNMAVPEVSDPGPGGGTAGASTPVQPVVFPNPWRADRNSEVQVTFGSLPAGSTVKIYTVTAQHVATLSVNSGMAQWDLRNRAGNRVASGVYYYLATAATGETAKGKLAVIR